MGMMLDLPALRRLHERASSEPWVNNDETVDIDDHAFYCAVHAALPALLARCEAGEKIVELLRGGPWSLPQTNTNSGPGLSLINALMQWDLAGEAT